MKWVTFYRTSKGTTMFFHKDGTAGAPKRSRAIYFGYTGIHGIPPLESFLNRRNKMK